MYEMWAKLIQPSGQLGPDYWTYFARRLVQQADLHARTARSIPGGLKILDVGTDDGNVLFKAFEALGGQVCGVGIDQFAGDFQIGMEAAQRVGWSKRVNFAQMDANAMGLAWQHFDCVLANFVGWDDYFDFDNLKFLREEQIAAEIRRVLKPGGLVGIGAWVEQSDIDWITRRFKDFYPALEAECEEWPICYSKENPAGYRMILQSSGFVDLKEVIETNSFACPDYESWWKQMRRAAGECFDLIREPLALQLFKEQVLSELGPYMTPNGVQFSKTVCYVYGTKPEA